MKKDTCEIHANGSIVIFEEGNECPACFWRKAYGDEAKRATELEEENMKLEDELEKIKQGKMNASITT